MASSSHKEKETESTSSSSSSSSASLFPAASSTSLWVIRIVFLLLFIGISYAFNRMVPQPYMDEIFHIPQARAYCEGRWHVWDPMITTPPGLYIFSVAVAYITFPVAYFFGFSSNVSQICTNIIFLRFSNVLLSMLSLELFHQLHLKLNLSLGNPAVDGSNQTSPNIKTSILNTFIVKTILCCLFPLHFFFAFVYYTDVGSTATVLSMYLFSLNKSYFIASVMGAIAIFFRQTNIIWVALVMCEGLMESSSSEFTKFSENYPSSSSSTPKRSVNASNSVHSDALRHRKNVKDLNSPPSNQKWNIEHSENCVRLSKTNEKRFSEALFLFIQICWKNKFKLLKKFWSFVCILISFCVFVYVNKGIVLGAKEHHKMSAHLAQILYFLAFSSINLAPLFFSPDQISRILKKCFSTLKSKPFFATFVLLTSFSLAWIIVARFSQPHPYLLADNRHYTFYIWRRIISRNTLSKFFLIPLYMYSGVLLTQLLLESNSSPLWIFFFYILTTLVLIPSPLLEFRYFNIPFLLIHFQLKHLGANFHSFIILVSYLIVNAATIYLFLLKPFQWEHEPQTWQRFMW